MNERPGESMQVMGNVLIGIGLLAVIVSWVLPITLTTDVPVYGEASSVVNLAKVQRQTIVFASGSLFALMGTILRAAGAIVRQFSRGAPAREEAASGNTVAPIVLSAVPPTDAPPAAEAAMPSDGKVLAYGLTVLVVSAIVALLMAKAVG